MTEKINRRKFFSMNFEASVGFLGNLLAPQFEVERDFFRPPGAYSELDFLTSCSRCGLCKEHCPENMIKLFSFSDGAQLLNTPYINPNESHCTFCNECINVCPTGALNHAGLTPIGLAIINKNTCLTFKEVMCDYCVYSCPVQGAITLVNGKPEINKNFCNGCGACVTNCISDEKGIYISTKVQLERSM
ncbi:4Fe-4S dicluster domain-containing protein [Bacillus dakarensis]|uniref:4Fe-4S dicluster domain-containing protein n=1 Tax=Robertmurraya dakarensis TaxID=1926278 RepID=UPI0009813611|nr:4Fe-4S dicluster domain-containing protein [Bacillus dakarensis]